MSLSPLGVSSFVKLGVIWTSAWGYMDILCPYVLRDAYQM